MSDRTKKALEQSLKNMMKKKPLDKITIADITNDCGVSRMSFYYYFRDIYDLVEWSMLVDAMQAVQGNETADTWHEGLLGIFEAVERNKEVILNAHKNMPRIRMENFLWKLTYGFLMGVVNEKSAGTKIDEEDKAFIADFYKYSFVGILMHWIDGGMKEDHRVLAEKMETTLQGNIGNSIQNFLHKQ